MRIKKMKHTENPAAIPMTIAGVEATPVKDCYKIEHVPVNRHQ